jgi:hypothetical protein
MAYVVGFFKDTKAGWSNESNIYYNKNLFAMVEHGCGDLQMEDYPDRGFFWARFKVVANPDITGTQNELLAS